jgi:hypothetical protein
LLAAISAEVWNLHAIDVFALDVSALLMKGSDKDLERQTLRANFVAPAGDELAKFFDSALSRDHIGVLAHGGGGGTLSRPDIFR